MMDNRVNPLAGEWIDMLSKKAVIQNNMQQTRDDGKEHPHHFRSILHCK